jgi:hypothetical protein
MFPAKQTRLLRLWDKLHLPHEKDKQVFGSPLTIIGLDVDPNTMTITMPQVACRHLVVAIHNFVGPGQRRPLHEFQQLAGWMNWALNAFPLLRPGLSLLYNKMSGKTHAHQMVWVSVALCHELEWFAEGISTSDGVHMMTAHAWGKEDAYFSLFCDACPSRMGFGTLARIVVSSMCLECLPPQEAYSTSKR